MDWLLFTPGFIVVGGGIVWRVRHDFRHARGQAVPKRRVKTRTLKVVHASWQQVATTAEAAKVSQEEQFEHRQERRRAARQGWATDFERLAGHTWDGPWEKPEPMPGHPTLYAVKEHWEAIGDKARQALIENQFGYSYGRTPADREKRLIAINAAAAWRKKAKPIAQKPETDFDLSKQVKHYQETVANLQQVVAQKEAYIQQMVEPNLEIITTMGDGGPVLRIHPSSPTRPTGSSIEDDLGV